MRICESGRMDTPEKPTDQAQSGSDQRPARFTWVIALQLLVAIASFVLWVYRLVTGDSRNAYETWWPLVIAIFFAATAWFFLRDRNRISR